MCDRDDFEFPDISEDADRDECFALEDDPDDPDLEKNIQEKILVDVGKWVSQRR